MKSLYLTSRIIKLQSGRSLIGFLTIPDEIFNAELECVNQLLKCLYFKH